MMLLEYKCWRCATVVEIDRDIVSDRTPLCTHCGAGMHRTYSTGGLSRKAGRSEAANVGEAIASEAPTSETDDAYQIRDVSVVNAAGVGVVVDGVPIDWEGGRFANNAGGDIKIRGSSHYRIANVDFD